MKNLFTLVALLAFALSISAQKQNSGAVTGAQPSFAALDMAGQRVDTQVLRGKVIVLNLWFVGCPNCNAEITSLNELVDQYKDNKDVVFLGLAVSSKPELQQFLAKHPFKYQIIPNAGMIILSKFGTPSKNGEVEVPFPMHYVLDREGKIVVGVQGVKGVDTVRLELGKQFSKKAGG